MAPGRRLEGHSHLSEEVRRTMILGALPPGWEGARIEAFGTAGSTFKVDVEGRAGALAVRLLENSSRLIRVTRQAAAAGLTARVINSSDADPGFLVQEWMEGWSTLSSRASCPTDPKPLLARLGELAARLHFLDSSPTRATAADTFEALAGDEFAKRLLKLGAAQHLECGRVINELLWSLRAAFGKAIEKVVSP